MATTIMMPRLSPTMEEGVLLKWHKRPGDRVSPGESIAEVETDKANMDFPLEDEGVILELLVQEGEVVKLGAPVAVLGEPGEKVGAAGSSPKAAATTAPIAAPTASPPPAIPAPPAVTPAPASRPKASPLARRLARELGLDLGTIQGSGPHGRIIKRDLDAAAKRRPTAPLPTLAAPPPGQVVASPPPAVQSPATGDQTVPLSLMRRTIARRLTEAKQAVPHFYLGRDADAEALVAFHQQLKEASDEKISLNDLLVKALAVALTRVPEANASFTEQGIVRYRRVDIAIAVSIDDGLLTPVAREVDRKPLGQLARETRDLVARARARKLKPEELTGATFSVSNLGMYGVREFAAIINPPEAGILAVGAVDKRPVVVTDAGGHDSLQIRRQISLTLSCDHRVLDGALGARLLAEIVRVVEKPVLLAL